MTDLRSMAVVEFSDTGFSMKWQAAKCRFTDSMAATTEKISVATECTIKGVKSRGEGSIVFNGSDSISLYISRGAIGPIDLVRCPSSWSIKTGRDDRSHRPYAIVEAASVTGKESLGIECQPGGLLIGIALHAKFDPSLIGSTSKVGIEVGERPSFQVGVAVKPTSDGSTVLEVAEHGSRARRVIDALVQDGDFVIRSSDGAATVFRDNGRRRAVETWAKACNDHVGGIR